MMRGQTSCEVSLTNRTRSRLISFPFTKAKDEILGKNYELSIVFLGTKAMAALNQQYRDKKGPTDILSFTVDKHIGEICICPIRAAKKAPQFNESSAVYLKRLLIHGMLHLKGYEHGSTMERHEEHLRTRFNS